MGKVKNELLESGNPDILVTKDVNEARDAWSHIVDNGLSGLRRYIGGTFYIFSPASAAIGHFTSDYRRV